MKKLKHYLIILFTAILIVGCSDVEDIAKPIEDNGSPQEETVTNNQETDEPTDTTDSTDTEDKTSKETASKDTSTETKAETKNESKPETKKNLFEGYTLIEVDGGDLSGHREPNVVVDIGFGARKYYAFTNEYGQLVRVIADEIILQDDRTEPVNSSGRYYRDEAKVPGVERPDLDEGHVIADSLGGVSNAYNITPQNSTLNRHGDQAYMEEMIRKAGGAKNFEAIITYPNTKTQIPSHYKYSFTLPSGKKVVMEFDNVDPDKVNEQLGLTGNKSKDSKSNSKSGSSSGSNSESKSGSNSGSKSGSGSGSNSKQKEDISGIDTNGDGKVTIKEAKAAGFKMPITKDHWLYKYMDDRDGDGMVGE